MLCLFFMPFPAMNKASRAFLCNHPPALSVSQCNIACPFTDQNFLNAAKFVLNDVTRRFPELTFPFSPCISGQIQALQAHAGLKSAFCSLHFCGTQCDFSNQFCSFFFHHKYSPFSVLYFIPFTRKNTERLQQCGNYNNSTPVRFCKQ